MLKECIFTLMLYTEKSSLVIGYCAGGSMKMVCDVTIRVLCLPLVSKVFVVGVQEAYLVVYKRCKVIRQIIIYRR